MGKWWSVLFAVVMLACTAMFVAAPLVGWWLPQGVSSHAWEVDRLFYFILFVTAFFFVLTEGILVWFVWRYAASSEELPVTEDNPTAEGMSPQPAAPSGLWTRFIVQPVKKVLYNQHRVELAWTIVPAIILLYIGLAQIGAWMRIKYESRMDRGEADAAPLQVEVVAHQFGWRVRYADPDRLVEWKKGTWEGGEDSAVRKDYNSFGRHPHMDDVILVNELHTWVDHPVVVHLSTRDVIHSFNLPHFRVKQDALPGKTIPVWFTPIKVNTRYNPKTGVYEDGFNPDTGKYDPTYVWDLACAELCGWGHYRMVGRMYVHKNYDEFLDWLQKAAQAAQKNSSAI